MTWPSECQQGDATFQKFMLAAHNEAGISTTNAAWTMVQGVFLAFRRRLGVEETVRFASVLPPLMCAVFLGGWNPHDEPVLFPTRQALVAEAQARLALERLADRAARQPVQQLQRPAATNGRHRT